MKPLLLILTLVVTHFSYGQKYEYISFYQVKAGIEDKAKIDFSWPDKPDSARYFNSLKLRDPLAVIQTMEAKGFELVSLNEYGPGSLVIVINTYMRRKRK